jgi:hypothetical protein
MYFVILLGYHIKLNQENNERQKILRFDIFSCGAGTWWEAGNVKIVKGFIQEAIDEDFKLIMIRPNMVFC